MNEEDIEQDQYASVLIFKLNELNRLNHLKLNKLLIGKRRKSKTERRDPTETLINIAKIKLALSFAKKYHSGQFRKSGEPYFSHPVEVASLVSDYRTNTDVLIAAILHDIIEDTVCTYEIVEREFGSRVREMVYKLTRIRDGKKIGIDQILRESYQDGDIDVILIKNCDRLHNLRTIGEFDPEKSSRIAKETLVDLISYTISLDPTSQFRDIEREIIEICTKYYEEDTSKESS